MTPSNMWKECQDEQCDFEEYIEAKENETKEDGIKLREVIKTNQNVEIDFTDIYTKCYEAVKREDELSDTFEMHLKCLDVLEKNYEERGYFNKGSDNYDDKSDNYDNTNNNNYNGNYDYSY